MASLSAAQQKQMPKDAQVIAAILKEFGVNEFEPRVINQLLEFSYRYITNVLDDAKAYANHAKKKTIDLDDVRLAVQMQVDKSFTTPPPRDILLEVARTRNNSPLPLVKPHCGIRLPPDRYCLNNCNYRLRSTAQKKFHTTSSSGGNYSSPQPSVKVSTKPGQLQLVKRPSGGTGLATIPRTQSLTAPKIKFSAGPQGLQSQHMLTTTGKTNIQISAPSFIKMETEDDNPLKRKREPDEFDVLEH